MSITFNQTLRPTSYGLFDSDPLFQRDAEAVVKYVLNALGEPILSNELSKKMIWSMFEKSTMEFSALIAEYQTISNLANILGSPTGSIDANGNNNINLTNTYTQQTLQFLSDLAAPYSALIGYGSFAQSYSGSITIKDGRQDYDLYTELVDSAGTPIYNLQPSGSFSKMQVYEVFHFAPVQYIFNSNLASNFVASGLPVESYIPDTRFYILPLHEDVLRGGMLKEAQKIRRSHYTYKITGRNIKIYPTPTNLVAGYNDKVWLRVGFNLSPYPSIASTIITSGSTVGQSSTSGGSSNSGQFNYVDNTLFGVNGPSNAPFGPIKYSSLNIWGRNWIASMTHALCTLQVGRVRSKFKNFPIPGAELTLNGDELMTQGLEEKTKLIESAREYLNNLSFDKLAERELSKASAMSSQLALVPINPRYSIKVG
jgi:hypothetical protein